MTDFAGTPYGVKVRWVDEGAQLIFTPALSENDGSKPRVHVIENITKNVSPMGIFERL